MTPLLFALVDAVLMTQVYDMLKCAIDAPNMESVSASRRAFNMLGWWRSTWGG